MYFRDKNEIPLPKFRKCVCKKNVKDGNKKEASYQKMEKLMS